MDLQERKKHKKFSSITYTTGDIQKNIDHFNKMLSGKEANTHTDGYLNGTFKNSAAEKACTAVGTFASQSPDGASSISAGSGDSSSCAACAESLIKEAFDKYTITEQAVKNAIENLFASPENPQIKAWKEKNIQVGLPVRLPQFSNAKRVELVSPYDSKGNFTLQVPKNAQTAYDVKLKFRAYFDLYSRQFKEEYVDIGSAQMAAKSISGILSELVNAIQNNSDKKMPVNDVVFRDISDQSAEAQLLKALEECDPKADANALFNSIDEAKYIDKQAYLDAIKDATDKFIGIKTGKYSKYFYNYDKYTNILPEAVLNYFEVFYATTLKNIKPIKDYLASQKVTTNLLSKTPEELFAMGASRGESISKNSEKAAIEAANIDISTPDGSISIKDWFKDNTADIYFTIPTTNEEDKMVGKNQSGTDKENIDATKNTMAEILKAIGTLWQGAETDFWNKYGKNLKNGSWIQGIDYDYRNIYQYHDKFTVNGVNNYLKWGISCKINLGRQGLKYKNFPQEIKDWINKNLGNKATIDPGSHIIYSYTLGDAIYALFGYNGGWIQRSAKYAQIIANVATNSDIDTTNELFDLQESGGKKGRKVTRYYIKPHNIWCAKKTDIINALIDHADQDCVVYTLINLDDNKDVTKLTPNDVIYYYEDGALYDKNHVKVMDYDLYVKHEEDRAKLDINRATSAQIEKVYDDRLTGNMTENLNESQSQEIGRFYRQLSKKYGYDFNDLVYGKDGFMQACYPNGFPDFKGDVIYSEKYWNEFEEWLKDNKGIILKDTAEDNELDLDFDDINVYGESLKESKLKEAGETICCICGEPLNGYGNNPEPYKSAEEGKCCDACQSHFVIPARLNLLDQE